jgi:hypothetical protein
VRKKLSSDTEKRNAGLCAAKDAVFVKFFIRIEFSPGSELCFNDSVLLLQPFKD